MLLHRKQTYQWKLKTWFEYFVKFLSILLADKFFKIPKSFKYQKQLPEMFYKESVLSSLSKFTGKDLCQSFLFKCFPVNFERFLRTPFSQNTSGRLLLKYCLPISLSLKMNQETKKTRNATRCNNRDDLVHLSFILKIPIFSEAYI